MSPAWADDGTSDAILRAAPITTTDRGKLRAEAAAFNVDTGRIVAVGIFESYRAEFPRQRSKALTTRCSCRGSSRPATTAGASSTSPPPRASRPDGRHRLMVALPTSQAVNLDETLAAHSINAAWQQKRDQEIGSIEVGKHATPTPRSPPDKVRQVRAHGC